jgi:hypothetical protein
MQKISIKNSHVVNHRYFRSKDEPKQSKGLLWPTLTILSCPANGRNRRVSPVAPRPRESPLTEPTAGVQPWPRERVLMPLSGPSPGPTRSLTPTSNLSVNRCGVVPAPWQRASAMSKSTGLVRNSAAIFRGLPPPLVVAVSGYHHDGRSGNCCLISSSNCSSSMSGILMSDLA